MIDFPLLRRMHKILLVAADDAAAELGGSVLFRSDIERTLVSDPGDVAAAAFRLLPHLVVIKDQPAETAEELVRQIKGTPETRRASVVVILPGAAAGAEMALRRAGASLAIAAPLVPSLWDGRLEELLAEPRRRDARIPAWFVVWPHSREAALRGTAVNLSVRGMLLETDQPLKLGTTLELSFELPGGAPGDGVGQVVREAPYAGGARRYGVDFIVLRGDSKRHINAFVESETGH